MILKPHVEVMDAKGSVMVKPHIEAEWLTAPVELPAGYLSQYASPGNESP